MIIKSRRQPPARVAWRITPSYAGKILVGLTEHNEICRASFLRNKKAAEVIVDWRKEWPKTDFIREKSAAQVNKKMLLVGTDFQCAVWRALAKIPFGKTKTYGNIAQQIGRARAVRAVGGACGANPVPFFIPCHRVVAAKGLGCFSAGLDVKQTLLRIERASIL